MKLFLIIMFIFFILEVGTILFLRGATPSLAPREQAKQDKEQMQALAEWRETHTKGGK